MALFANRLFLLYVYTKKWDRILLPLLTTYNNNTL